MGSDIALVLSHNDKFYTHSLDISEENYHGGILILLTLEAWEGEAQYITPYGITVKERGIQNRSNNASVSMSRSVTLKIKPIWFGKDSTSHDGATN